MDLQRSEWIGFEKLLMGDKRPESIDQRRWDIAKAYYIDRTSRRNIAGVHGISASYAGELALDVRRWYELQTWPERQSERDMRAERLSATHRVLWPPD